MTTRDDVKMIEEFRALNEIINSKKNQKSKRIEINNSELSTHTASSTMLPDNCVNWSKWKNDPRRHNSDSQWKPNMYKVIDMKRTQQQARRYCRKCDADLVSFMTYKEYEFIVKKL